MRHACVDSLQGLLLALLLQLIDACKVSAASLVVDVLAWKRRTWVRWSGRHRVSRELLRVTNSGGQTFTYLGAFYWHCVVGGGAGGIEGKA